MRREVISREDLLDCLLYYPETGEFRWRNGTQRLTGQTRKDGYVVIELRHKYYLAHRLAWLIMKGEWPPNEIDHINGNPSDNRILNLRACTCAENQENKAASSRNTTGYIGVFKTSKGNGRPFSAAIQKNRKKWHLGHFDTAEEAAEAYRKAKAEIHTFSPAVRGEQP